MQRARGVVPLRYLTFVGIVSLLTLGCGDALTDTAVVAPSDSRCQTTVGATLSTFPHSGGRGTITVDAARECQWSAASNASWIGLTPSSGQGAATVTLSVRPNADTSERTGLVTINQHRVELRQGGAPPPDPEPPPAAAPGPPPTPGAPPPPAPSCSYRADPDALAAPARGGQQEFTLVTATGCEWEAISTASWIEIATPRGSGRATVRVRVAENSATSRRTAAVRAGGISVAVSQDGATSPPPPPPGGGNDDDDDDDDGDDKSEKPEKVDLEGSVGALSGRCPSLSFKLRGSAVVTDDSTRFRKGSCDDIRNGINVKLKGERSGSGPIRADEVELKR